MRRGMAAALAAAGTAALVAAGCGGGGSDRLSLEEFIAQADAICAEYDERFEALGEPTTMEELSELVAEGASIGEEQLGELRALVPPEEVEARIEEAYAALEEQLGLFDDLAEAAAANDEAKVEEIGGQAEELDGTADAIAKEVGLEECGNDDG